MIRFTYNDIPGTMSGGVVSFAGTRLNGVEDSINAEVRLYADTHANNYYPDLNEVALLILRETGTVVVIDATPPSGDIDKVY